MIAEREISVDMTTDERSTVLDEPDTTDYALSPAARAAVLSAAPYATGIQGWWFTCSIEVARELLAWAKARMGYWRNEDPIKSHRFYCALRQLQFALWKIGEGPPPESLP